MRDLTEKTFNVSALAASDIKLSLFFGEVNQPGNQQTKLVRLVKKVIIIGEKRRKMALLNKTFSLPKPKFYPRIYDDCYPT